MNVKKKSKISPNERIPETVKRNSSGNGDRVCDPETSTTSPEIEQPQNPTPSPVPDPTEGNIPEQIDVMRLNVVHLLFLHGLLVKFYESITEDQKMREFLHDLILLFEIYIEAGNPTDDLLKTFNYQPLKIEENGI